MLSGLSLKSPKYKTSPESCDVMISRLVWPWWSGVTLTDIVWPWWHWPSGGYHAQPLPLKLTCVCWQRGPSKPSRHEHLWTVTVTSSLIVRTDRQTDRQNHRGFILTRLPLACVNTITITCQRNKWRIPTIKPADSNRETKNSKQYRRSCCKRVPQSNEVNSTLYERVAAISCLPTRPYTGI